MYARLNPVARQMKAMHEMKLSMLDAKINLYLLETGEECAALLHTLTTILLTISFACQAQKLDGYKVNQLRGGLSASIDLLQKNSYDPLQTVAIVTSIDRALELLKELKPKFLLQGMKMFNASQLK